MLVSLVAAIVAAVLYGVAAVAALASGLGLWGLVLATYVADFVRTVVVWLLAGWRPAALRRAATYGDGWIGYLRKTHDKPPLDE